MRTFLSVGAVAIALGFVTPASAQMCGGAGGMCGGSMTPAQAQSSTPAPMTTPGQSTPQQAGGCACCKNMAMMRSQGGQGMPGMDMPKQ